MITGIAVSPGPLDPVFNAATKTYTVSVPATVSQVKVTPAKASSGVQSVTINSTAVSYYYVKPMIGGSAQAKIVATATDGKTKDTYTVTVQRAALVEDIDVSAGHCSSSRPRRFRIPLTSRRTRRRLR